MTQPVSSDDVTRAQDMMNGSTKANSDTDAEEEELNFVDRLKFFSQLSASKSPSKAKVPQRSDTQPVKSSQISEAARQFERKAEEKVEGKPPRARPPPLQPVYSPKRTPVAIVSPTISKLTRKFSVTSSEDESLLSSTSSSGDDPEPGKKKLLLSSSDESSDMSVRVSELKPTVSIHERMKRLQKNQAEEKWKRQGRNSEIKSSVTERLNSLKGQEDKWKKSSSTESVARVQKLSDRIAKMKEDSETWKGKTGKQNDAAQFTVQAKLAKREGKKVVAVLPSPVIKRRVVPSSPPTAHRSVSIKDVKTKDDSASMNQLSFVEKLANKGLEENVIKTVEVHTTEVPTIDHEEFDKFFSILDIDVETQQNGFEEDIENFPEHENVARLSDIGRLKSSVKAQAKRRSSKRNPLKALAARTDLKQSYDTERLNIAKLEQQRIAVQRGHGANFTAAALAGLAEKADLKKVNLRSTKSTPMPSNDDLKPFQDVMLIRAKGRRKVQTRLVEPCAKSLCSDDAFLLVTPKKLFAWFGEFCNVIERAKINEIADYIVIKGDLGCKVNALRSIEENSNTASNSDFWEFLGGLGEWDKSTRPGGDEQYEADVETTVKTYKMNNSNLEPHSEAWGKLPRMEMLQPADTYVFDFGAEMYIWQGKEVSFADRRLAVRLARVLWEQDYDYTEQGICPFHSEELKGERPKFGLFARVNENLETSLFQEKFDDWSNIHREIGKEEEILRETSRGRAIAENETKTEITAEMEACDVKSMISNRSGHTPLLIDGFDVALGDGDIVDEDGRVLEIVTAETEYYVVTDKNVEKMEESVLHRENAYVVKWKYSISCTGRFESSHPGKSKGTRNGANGRQKVAYFSWSGPDSAMNEKGASALIAANMDTDDGPVINLTEETAPLVFNKCFRGNLVICNGKRGTRRGGFNWKLFRVKGRTKDSVTLSEVSCECKSLRSCSSFVALLPREAKAFVWHGCRSPQEVKESAEYAINHLSNIMPGSIPFGRAKTSIEVFVHEEGQEMEDFWEALGIKRRNRYECLIDSVLPTVPTRAWHFTIESQAFLAKELEPGEPDTHLPVSQSQLNTVEKPCLLLIESTSAIFLWQNCDFEILRGSSKRRWDVIRRLAIETTINFCKEQKRDEATLIEAGSEPLSFTNSFPSWVTKEKSSYDKLAITKPKPVSEVLNTLSRLTYTIDELRAKELPDGVDARHLETYLSNEDFFKLFEMTKADYYKMPSWKQIQLRQQKNFF